MEQNSVLKTGRRGRPSAADIRLRMAELLKVARSEFVRNGYRNSTMAHIAKAAGLTKRTLYLWHENKEALFRACIIEGAERFPRIEATPGESTREILVRYLTLLILELAREDANAFGRLLLREGSEFPELAPMAEHSHNAFIIVPLSGYLRERGYEEPGSCVRTELLVSMALAPVHNSLLLGRSMPGPPEAEAHAAFVVDFFLSCRP